MFDVFFSNRFERLAERLAQRLGEAGGGAFREDVVIVPSAAVRRSLTLELARRHGICAHVSFDYLAAWLWRQVAAFDPGVGGRSPLEAGPLAWRMWSSLSQPWPCAHPRLQGWLGGADDAMRFEFASALAELFGQYATYRHGWLEQWSTGRRVDVGSPSDVALQDERWQGELWRRVAEPLGLAGQGNPLQRFAEAIAAGQRVPLPPEIHVFCQPSIAPLYLQVLAALGQAIQVNVYSLNPCAEYWLDLTDRRRLAYLAAQGALDFQEEGHRLLAAWGKQAQSQLGLLIQTLDVAVEDARFEPGAQPTLLAAVQNSILDLTEPTPGAWHALAQDRSIEVHVCHSPVRELEVLHDRLLAIFTHDEGVVPGDVLVAVPDLDTLAPLIDAVFGTVERARFIPYTITGLGRARVNPVARALLDLLVLAPSRLPVSGVVGLLEQPPVAGRFGLDQNAIQLVRDWLCAAGVHWGMDAAHRESLDLPRDAAFSLEDGLDRLFLGYALPSAVREPFDGVLPVGDAEGTQALALGALSRFVDRLAVLRRDIARSLAPDEWRGLLLRTLEDFVSDVGVPEDLREARGAVERMAADMSAVGDGERVPFEVVRIALKGALDDPARGGVPTGAVTFTSIASLRHLPFRVVCVLGLGDTVFPGSSRPFEFDLISHAPRIGDRQRRVDDRNLFLDLLLAARDIFHLSYVGNSQRDNAVLPPSVLVSELLDWLVPNIAQDPQHEEALAQARRQLVVAHPLQPFSPSVFQVDADERVRSHDAGYALALRARAGQSAAPVSEDTSALDTDDDDALADGMATCLFSAPLPEPAAEWQTLDVDQLIDFLRNPCRYLLRRRLGIALVQSDEALCDEEPFLPEVPAVSALARRLLPALLSGVSDDAVRALARAGRELPAGPIGETLLDKELAELRVFADRVSARHNEPVCVPLELKLPIAVHGTTWSLEGTLPDLRASGLVRFRCDKARATDHLSAWVYHLALCASAPAGVQRRTTWVLRDGDIVFGPCAGATAQLQALLELYAEGLRQPVYFFPRSAWAWALGGMTLSVAKGRWSVSERNPHAEAADPSNRLALRGLPDPMGAGFARFEDCARRVYGPLIAALESSPALVDAKLVSNSEEEGA